MQSLLMLVTRGSVSAIETFLEKNGNIEARDRDGRTLLTNAVIERAHGIMAFLLRQNADPDSQDNNGWAPMHFAAQSFDLKSAKLLLRFGAQLDIRDKFGNTPLWRAVFSFNRENRRKSSRMIKFLLRQGANKRLPNEHGISPLGLAEDDFEREVIKLLQNKGE